MWIGKGTNTGEYYLFLSTKKYNVNNIPLLLFFNDRDTLLGESSHSSLVKAAFLNPVKVLLH
jgi:hypothetical protein